MIDVLPAELGDVNESVHTTKVDEGTKVHDRGDDAVATLARFQVRQEVAALFFLSLFEPGATREHDVVTVAVEFDDLRFNGFANVGLELAYASKFHERCRQEAPQANVNNQATFDDLNNDTLDNLITVLKLFNVGPRLFVLSTLLREYEATFLVLFLQDQAFNLFTERNDLRGVDVVANRKLARRDDAFGLKSNVEEYFVVVDLDHGAGDEVTVFEFEHTVTDEARQVRTNQIVFGDDSRNVVPFGVKGAHLLG